MAVEMDRADSQVTEIRLARAMVADGEAALVAAAKRGNQDAFGELFTRYKLRILRLAQNITRNREDAEEIAQEAFMQAFAHLDTFHGDSRFSTWLTRIAVNAALMRLRKKKPSYEISLDEPGLVDDAPLSFEVMDSSPSPEQSFSHLELQHVLSEAIGRLAEGERIVVQLCELEELSSAETARALGLTVSTVKSRLFRARAKLRQALDQSVLGKRVDQADRSGWESRPLESRLAYGY